MNKETYSFPKGPTARYDFQRSAFELSTANATLWGVPAELLATIAPLKIDFEQKYSVANNRNTQSIAATANRDAAWDVLAVPLGELYAQYLVTNSAISAADKLALNLHTDVNKGATVTPAAITTPVVLLMAEEASVLHVVFTDSGSASGSHAKPNGVAFCEIWAKIDGAAPATTADCPERFNIARSHEGIVFDQAQRQKAIYGFARWVNKNGKVGVWGNAFSAIVP